MQTLNNSLHALRRFLAQWFLPLAALAVGLLGTPAYAQAPPAGAGGRAGAAMRPPARWPLPPAPAPRY